MNNFVLLPQYKREKYNPCAMLLICGASKCFKQNHKNSLEMLPASQFMLLYQNICMLFDNL